MDSIMDTLDAIALNPNLKPLLILLKAARNGAVYGAKVRFPHALVMVFLFRSGTFREKVKLVLKATRQHASNLARFAVIYKSAMFAMKYLNPTGPKEGPYDTFFAGLLGGYVVFGRNSGSVSQQVSDLWKIVIYVFARVVLALASLSVQPNMHPLSSLITPESRSRIQENAWPAFAALSWAAVMYVFRWHPESIVSSLRSSMTYIYVDSDHWTSFHNLLIHNK
uniref:Peroxisomal membrane protein 4 n=1 Tax=Talaromyces marneffei PM1 TaxID=1077442 RepID=A0A093V0A2_TALMA